MSNIEAQNNANPVEWQKNALENFQTMLSACSENNNQRKTKLYGLIDSAANDVIYPLLTAEPPQSKVQCLFDQTPGFRYRNVAPYLIELNQLSPLTSRWLADGWQQHWGIWLSTSRPADELKAHLKKFLFIQKSDKTKALFRYYDPRIMEKMLPQLTPLQCGEFFGLNYKPMPDAIFTVRAHQGQKPMLKRHMARQHGLLRLTGVGICDTQDFSWQPRGL